MVRKLRLKSGEEAAVERITKKKIKHKMIKVKIKMRRNSKLRGVKMEESKTKSCGDDKIQNKTKMRWWYWNEIGMPK